MSSPEAEVGASVLGKSRLGGVHSAKVSEVKASLKVDGQNVSKLDKEFGVLRKTIDSISLSFERMAKSAARAGSAAAGATSATGMRTTATNGMPLPPPAPVSPVVGRAGASTPPAGGLGAGSGGIGRIMGRGGAAMSGGPLGGATGGALVGGLIAGQVAGSMVGALDNRVNRGIDYAMSADRLSVQLQQQFGKSQMQVMQEMRQPLAQMRLGAGGVNAMLQFQSQTGVQATSQTAQSIAGIRALSGYSKTTADVLTDQRSLMDPTTANRMFSMLGTNAYNIGGGTKDPMALRQQIVQSMGLANESILKGALTPGSIVRDRMSNSGIGQEMQDELIQYAQSQVNFQKKGGQGMYNPGNKDHRKTMGIEDNFATQVEETEAKRTQREEQFMERQVDNYASLEKNTQTMVGLLGSIEDKLSGIIGARTASRGWQRIGGRLMQAAGVGLMASGVGAGAGAAMVIGGGALAGGDPDGGGAGATGTPASGSGSNSAGNDGNIAIPIGYGGGKATLNEVKQRGDFKKLNPKMQERLLRMFRENPNVGIGGGFRDSSAQEAMFRQRYRPTDKDTGIQWQGQNWEHVSGAAAAPPGRSMHEIGLAADLVGDLNWMNANASRFGLKHFAGVNNEPWHVQPSELPNSRREYESGGAAWGTDNYFAADDEAAGKSKPVTGGSDHGSEHAGMGGGGGGATGYGGMSISQIVDAITSKTSNFRGSGPRGGGKNSKSLSSSSTTGGAPVVPGAGGALSGEQIARLAHQAGFRGDDLARVVAIAKRESGWRPGAYNPNRATADDSYGLMQINMLGAMEAQRLKLFGIGSKEALYDPLTNLQAAFKLYQNRGNQLTDWGGYKGKEDTYNTDVSSATQIVKDAGLYSGDPSGSKHASAPMPRGGGHTSSGIQTPMVLSPTYDITVAPVIQLHSTGSTPTHAELKKLAQDVGLLLKDEMRTLSMRTE